jgi:hypothetical protein
LALEIALAGGEVALKILPASVATDPDGLAAFHALEMGFTKRLSRRWQASGTYTLSVYRDGTTSPVPSISSDSGSDSNKRSDRSDRSDRSVSEDACERQVQSRQ